MERVFYFQSALVTRGSDYVRVRFWARTGDQMQLLPAETTKRYESDADIILLVDGEEGGEPNFPEMEEGEQLFTGPSIEVVFRGGCDAEITEDEGLRVIVPDGKICCIRSVGLPFTEAEVLKADQFNLLADIAALDKPPHRPPSSQP